MNVYYSIDDLNLSDGPVIVNMIIERENGQQSVSSLAPDAVVEEFNLQGLVDAAEVEQLKAELEECKIANLRMTSELGRRARDRDEFYRIYKTTRDEIAELSGKLKECERARNSVCKERDEFADELQAAREEFAEYVAMGLANLK